MNPSSIHAAVAFVQKGQSAPKPADVVAALLAAEKESKRKKQRYAYEDLLGTWRLIFVSGTKTKKTAGGQTIKAVGSGRFLPRFVAIALTYNPPSQTTDPAEIDTTKIGSVENAVAIGPLNLRLSGPTRFWPNTNSLAFDFTSLRAQLGAITLYNGSIRGGGKGQGSQDRNAAFKTQSLKEQAFFTFFRVEPDYIAARGKGGGLALWIRSA